MTGTAVGGESFLELAHLEDTAALVEELVAEEYPGIEDVHNLSFLFLTDQFIARHSTLLVISGHPWWQNA